MTAATLLAMDPALAAVPPSPPAAPVPAPAPSLAAPRTLDALTLTVSADLAAESASQRRRSALASALLGGLSVGLGTVFLLNADETDGGLVSFERPTRYLGWTFVGLGGALLLLSPIPLVSESELERDHARLEAGLAAGDPSALARRRAKLIDDADHARDVRAGLAIAGSSLLAVGAVSFTLLALTWDDVDGTTALTLVGLGAGGVGIGAGLLGGSLVRTPHERSADRLRRPAPTLGLAPLRGGGMVGLAGSF